MDRKSLGITLVVFIIPLLALFAINYILNDSLDGHRELFSHGMDRDITAFVTHAQSSGMPATQAEAIRQLAVDIKEDTHSYVMWSLTSIANNTLWVGLFILMAVLNLSQRMQFKDTTSAQDQQKKRLLIMVVATFALLAVGAAFYYLAAQVIPPAAPIVTECPKAK